MIYSRLFYFFFQAEDSIRDAQESRGLGDVYKRQGQMAALGRINPATYDEDESLESLIAVVPFGVGSTPPVHTRPAIKGVVPGIGPDDKVILWGGGIWNLSLIHISEPTRLLSISYAV